MAIFLGIDGGGTKTRCVIGDDSAILGTGSGSGCNVLRVGESCARDSLAAAIHEACVQAGVSPREITRTCAGIAGASDDGTASRVQRLLIEIVGGAIEVLGDMEVAFESAFGGEAGILVIAGTGSVAYGRNSHGDAARAGGWGRIISDEGSGHWIVVHALGLALRARDRGEDSALLRKLMAGFGADEVDDLIVKVNESATADFAGFFPIVLEAANDGDGMADSVLSQGGRELAKVAAIVAERLFPSLESVQVAMHGGVFLSSARVKEAFQSELRQLCPSARCSDGQVDPLMGALARARREYAIWHRPGPEK